VFVVCRRGNDSQKGVLTLRKALSGLRIAVKDIMGGLHSWAKDIDPSFPVYWYFVLVCLKLSRGGTWAVLRGVNNFAKHGRLKRKKKNEHKFLYSCIIITEVWKMYILTATFYIYQNNYCNIIRLLFLYRRSRSYFGMSRYRAPLWDLRPDITSCRSYFTADSQSVCLGIEHPWGTCDQI
jgi:hypothetical protein